MRRIAPVAILLGAALGGPSPWTSEFEPLPIEQIGRDRFTRVRGGCEVGSTGASAPDRYLDAGEVVFYDVSFRSTGDATDVTVGLRAVRADADSPASCAPGSLACVDPDRSNNLVSTALTILGSPVVLPAVAAGTVQTVSFTILVADEVLGTPKTEFLVDISSGAIHEILVARTRLDVDEQSLLYSTDFPLGGLQDRDLDGDGSIENPIMDPGGPLDGRYETTVWSDLTAGGTVNLGVVSPWHFDSNFWDVFSSGVSAITDPSQFDDVIALWGEDTNFNYIDDKRCSGDPRVACSRITDCTGIGSCLSIEDRDPANGILEKNWNIRGGCGWQTKSPNVCSNDLTSGCFSDADCPFGLCNVASPGGGVWHTGRIGGQSAPACMVSGSSTGQCQTYETIGGTGNLRWFELLTTPVMAKVSAGLDADGDPTHTAEIRNFAWNLSLDLADAYATFTWEVDNDVLESWVPYSSLDLTGDDVVLGSITGPFGAVSGGDPDALGGFPMFAPIDGNGDSSNLQREGRAGCFFEGAGVSSPPYRLAQPLDGSPFVTTNGPIRNMDITVLGGPDLTFELLEDRIGDVADYFQAAFGFMVTQKVDPSDPDPQPSFGAAVDDVVIEWREFTLVADATGCAPGEPRILSVQKDGEDVLIDYESGCASANHNLEFGPLASVGTYGYSGHDCSIGDGGVYRFEAGPGDYFLTVVPTDGVAIEGSYGRDSTGVERPEDTTDWDCAFTQQLAGRCDLSLLGQEP